MNLNPGWLYVSQFGSEKLKNFLAYEKFSMWDHSPSTNLKLFMVFSFGVWLMVTDGYQQGF